MFMKPEPSTYVVEKDVPMPTRRPHHNYPFRDMEIGDSFVAEGTQASRQHCAAYSAAMTFSNRNPEYRFSGRKEGDNHVRIFRVD